MNAKPQLLMLRTMAALAICAVLWSLFAFIGDAPSARDFVFLTLASTVLLVVSVIYLYKLALHHVAVLLEPKTGGSVLAGAGNTYDYRSDKAHRQRLEEVAMSSLASGVNVLSGEFDPAKLGLEMRQAIDAMLGSAPSPSACTCGPNEGCSKCPPKPLGAVPTPVTKTTADAVMAAGMGAQPDSIEAMIQAKGKVAPRVTPADVEANISDETYFTAAEGRHGHSHKKHGFDYEIEADESLHLLTFCVLTLRNGFTVTGESACASPENFDAEIGRKIARENAVQKIWPLMGYELRSQLAKPVLTEADALADLNGTRRPDNHAG